MLPEMDGFEVVHRLHVNADWRDTPVILLTASDLSHEDRRALDTGTTRIIQKGNFTRDELLAELRQAIGERSAGAASESGVQSGVAQSVRLRSGSRNLTDCATWPTHEQA